MHKKHSVTNFWKFVRVFLFVLVLGLVWGVCAFILTLVVFDNRPGTTSLSPTLTYTKESWERERPAILAALEKYEYGTVPKTHFVWDIEKEILDNQAFSGKGVYELWTFSAPENAFVFHVVVLIPKGPEKVPIVLTSNFCPNHVRFPEFNIPMPSSYPSMCGSNSMTAPLMRFVFGPYIETFPLDMFIENQVAFAGVYLAEGVPDDPALALPALEKLSTLSEKPVTGTLAAWAWTYGEILHALEQDPRINASQTALYGHSRDGKAALLSAASNPAVDLVLAHQSGKGGASPWANPTGESIADVIKNYPYWFTPSFAKYASRKNLLPVDQHQLLALIAPRPILLTGARFDKWGDPRGALTAAQSALPIYALYNPAAHISRSLGEFTPNDPLSFYMRGWFHGVQPSDWESFFIFLSVHFDAEAPAE